MTSTPVFDVLACGFGPASLALAIALVEPTATRVPEFSSLGGLQEALLQGQSVGDAASSNSSSSPNHRPLKPLRACFIEKHDRFRWHPGMMLEGSNMQISFLKDLATLRNPQSAYTFLCYLASFTPSRLVSYISRETFTPTRREFSDYLAWAARKVEAELEQKGGEIGFGEEVVAIEAVTGADGLESDIKLLKVTSRKVQSSEMVERFTRNLVLSTGGSPRIPEPLTHDTIVSTGRVIHTSEFLTKMRPVLSELSSPLPIDRPLRVAVFGSGQSAAETFLAARNEIAAILPSRVEHRPQVSLFIRKATLRPADDSASTNEVFDPGMSQAVYGIDEEGRAIMLESAKATNYSVANPKTLASMYEIMYAQQVEDDIAARDCEAPYRLNRDPKLVIRPFSELAAASTLDASRPITLTIANKVTHVNTDEEFDVVVCGTGYDRQGWRNLLFTQATGAKASVPLSEILAPSHAASPPTLPRLPSATSLSSIPASAFALDSRLSRPASTATSDEHSRSSTSHGSPLLEGQSSLSRRAWSVDSSTASSPPPSRGSYSKEREGQSPLYAVAKNYRLQLPQETIYGAKFRPSVWLQGSCEATHGISDSLLSVLAVRSGEVMQALYDEGWFGDE